MPVRRRDQHTVLVHDHLIYFPFIGFKQDHVLRATAAVFCNTRASVASEHLDTTIWRWVQRYGPAEALFNKLLAPKQELNRTSVEPRPRTCTGIRTIRSPAALVVDVLAHNLPALHASKPAQLCQLVLRVLPPIRRAHPCVNGRSHKAAPIWIEPFSEKTPAGT